MNGIEESDRSIVPMKQPNKAEQSAAEVAEGREGIAVRQATR